MSMVIAKTIVGCVGCLSVLLATKWTNNPNCLWALILVAMIVERV